MTIDAVHSGDAERDPVPDADHLVDRLRPEEAKELIEVCKMLGEKIRLEVFDVLTRTLEMHVADLQQQTSAATQPALSHHLGLMRASGLLHARRDGKHIFYSIVPGPRGDFVRKVIEAWKESALESQN